MPAIRCTKCGFENPPGMRFCGNCGTRLEEPTSAPQPIEPTSLHDLPGKVGVMMGADLLERFRQAGLEAAGQRRNVTVLFADLSGFTAYSHQVDSEDAYALIQQFIGLMVKDVYKYDGMVDKFMGDGLMAIFGAPIAHENSSELAIRSAIEMQADVSRLGESMKDRLPEGLVLHVGLHSGPVVVGSIGTNMLMNYTAIGDTVNLAYRLVENAPPGTILVSEAVYQHTHPIFDFNPVEPLHLKGLPQPVSAFAVVGLRSQPGPVRGIEGMRAPMIGRDVELSLLDQIGGALAEARQSSFVFIQGEAGIGKSRLVAEFVEHMRGRGIYTLTGCSFTYRRSMSYWIFLDLLRGYLGVPTNAPEADVREKLTRKVDDLLGAHGSEVFPFLEYLFSLKTISGETSEKLRFLDAPQLRRQIFMAVRDLLVAEARRNPIVLIFEDLHWADESSLDLLEFLIEAVRQEPVMIVSISRPTPETALQKVIEQAYRSMEERFYTIQLQSLSAAQSQVLLEKLLSIQNLPVETCQEIIDHSAGNPFYLEEIIRMLIDEKIIHETETGWDLIAGANIASLGVPDTLQGLILARFDRLDEIHRRVLQVASLIGRDFNSKLLKMVLGAPGGAMEAEADSAAGNSYDPPIPEILNDLTERGFIIAQPGTSDPDYRFKHALVSDAIYGTLLKSDRSTLHGQTGEAIETLYADRIDEQIELLARHYYWSARYDRALHYLILAGQKAARGYANEQARQHFEQGLDVLKKVAHEAQQTLELYTGLGDVQAMAGEYPEARASYQSALESITSNDPRIFARERSNLQRKIGTTFERQGDYAQALSYLSSAQATLEYAAGPSPVEVAWIANDTGWIHFRRGNLEMAEKTFLAALNEVEDTHQYDVIASIYNRLGGVYYAKDMIDLASNYVRKSLFLRQEIGDVNAVARSYNNLGLLRWKRGDWDSALDDFMRSLILHSNLGDVEGTIELHANLGLLQIDRGNFDDAEKHLISCLESAKRIGHSYHIGLAYLHFSRLYTALEDWTKALEFCHLGLQTFNEIGALEYMVDLNTYAGMAYLGLRNVEAARQYAQEALSLFDRMNAGKTSTQAEDRGRALRLLGQVNLAEGNPEGADEALKESADIFNAIGNQIEQGRTAYARALTSLYRQDDTSARMLLNEARLIFRQLGARVDLRKVDGLTAGLTR